MKLENYDNCGHPRVTKRPFPCWLNPLRSTTEATTRSEHFLCITWYPWHFLKMKEFYLLGCNTSSSVERLSTVDKTHHTHRRENHKSQDQKNFARWILPESACVYFFVWCGIHYSYLLLLRLLFLNLGFTWRWRSRQSSGLQHHVVWYVANVSEQPTPFLTWGSRFLRNSTVHIIGTLTIAT